MEQCSFCRIAAGELPGTRVYEDEKCMAIMDIQPINTGHVLVIPKQHVTLIRDLADEMCAHLMVVGKKVGAAIRASGIEHEALCYFLADGDAAGQEIPHVHLHVFPRYPGDGFRLMFPPDYMHPPERAELEKVAAEIRKGLS
jgi:histidine triad (HIT) family protein